MGWFRRRESAGGKAAEAEVVALRERVTELEAELAARERELQASAVAVNDALAAIDSLEAGMGDAADDEQQTAERPA